MNEAARGHTAGAKIKREVMNWAKTASQFSEFASSSDIATRTLIEF
jgi:hypothetical protein